MLICILAAFGVSKRIYLPFEELYTQISKNKDVKTDELEFIKNVFEEYNKKIDLYDDELKNNERIIKEYSIVKLLKNSAELSEKNIEKIFSAVSLNVDTDFVVVVLSLDEIEYNNEYIDNIVNYALYNISLEVVRRKFKAEGQQGFGNSVQIIINVKENTDYEKELVKAMKEIQKHMVYNFGVNVSMGISSLVHSVEKISLALEEAIENLNYRFNYGVGKFFSLQNVASNINNPKTTISDTFEELIVQAKDEKSAVDIFTKIINEIEAMSYFNAIIETTRISKILNAKFNIDINLPVNFAKSDIFTGKTLPVFYEEVCEKLKLKFINSKNKDLYEQSEMQLIEGIKKYVEENYHKNTACIVDMSEKMNVSQRKLSETFKSHENMFFATYLTKYRIEKAKEYILNTDLSMTKISEKIGISNDTYFYRLFKLECGMTPKEYKKYYSQNN